MDEKQRGGNRLKVEEYVMGRERKSRRVGLELNIEYARL